MEENKQLLPKKDPEANKKEEKPKPINYKFLDGVRGFGAFAVYLYHNHCWHYEAPTGTPDDFKLKEEMTWIKYYKSTPFTVFVKGPFWVYAFFIISGFVLPLRWFQTRNPTCIYGGTFRRYPRLMIPCWVIMSLYYFVVKMDLPLVPWTGGGIDGKTVISSENIHKKSFM